MAWRKPETRDLTAKLNQRELEAFKIHPDYASMANPASDLLAQTAEFVRGFCRRNRQLAMSPNAGTIPESLMSPAMDIAAFDVLKRINVTVNEARKSAWERAIELLKDVASGAFTPESYDPGGGEEANARNNLALPGFTAEYRNFILNERL